MPFEILYGYPEIEEMMDSLRERMNNNELGKNEIKYLKKIVTCLDHLSKNPAHNSLNSHKIDVLSKQYGVEVWESYLENHVPAAGRIFWLYGPEKKQITIAAIEPHPEKNAYSRVRLSVKPKTGLKLAVKSPSSKKTQKSTSKKSKKKK